VHHVPPQEFPSQLALVDPQADVTAANDVHDPHVLLATFPKKQHRSTPGPKLGVGAGVGAVDSVGFVDGAYPVSLAHQNPPHPWQFST